jgi:hypothetical protein
VQSIFVFPTGVQSVRRELWFCQVLHLYISAVLR